MAGFPHSDIHGSILACSSPWLFAAYRVLLRLLAPRHPPYALSSLTSFLLSSHFRVPSLVTLSKLLFKRFFTFQFLLYTFQGSKNGGDEENRTPDPLLARQVLSQLSYAPILPVVVC